MTDVFRTISSCIIALFCCLLPVFSITGEHPILIISSYNPDAGRTSGNISDFMEEFQRLGGTNTIALENMNCKSFSESPLWERRMVELLSKYQGDNSPALTVLIGQEAWAAYLSLPDSIRGNTPVVSALSSRNAILLPGDTVDLKTWMPESVDFFTDFPSSPIKAGFVYEYDVEANINMIKQMYPGTKNIAFVSDNSYGGVAMQAYVVKEMQKFPELNLILLDGRVHTIYTICDRLHELPENTAILMGTWRVDMNDGYFMRNATYAMMEAAPTLPTFSLSSVGLGYWAVAGVVPAYRALGKEMARQSYRLLTTPQDSETHMEIIPNETILDGKLVKEKKLNITGLPQPVKMLNVTPSFYEQYKYHIWSVGAVLLVLLGGLFVSLYFYYHTKKLKDELEVSEGALREAKDRAEESSRLKSAFLANMSHEIRTPLNAIVGFSDVLSAGGASEEEQRGYFEIIRTNSDLLLRLINDILDVSRLEADRVILSLESCNVVQICQQVVASVAQARRSTNQFLFECEREVVEMRTDVQRLQQVVINLLSNADKFTKEGTITLKLEPDTARNVAAPVREAFQILAHDGLIKLRPNKGAIVLGITETYIREHYQIRGILEGACAGFAASPDIDISKIEQSYLDAREMTASGDYSRYADLNREFHSEIWAASGNKKMENMIAELWNGLSMGSMVTEEEYAGISIKEHEAIYEAIKAHDVQLAQRRMYEHIMRSRDDMLTYYV